MTIFDHHDPARFAGARPPDPALTTIPTAELMKMQQDLAFLRMTNNDLSAQFNAAKRVALRHGATEAEITAETHVTQ